MHEFCKDVERYLSRHNDNIAAIHCKAGKGRTGVMICCFLIYNQMCNSAYEALLYYGKIRTRDGKGVTIPSQIRYVYYFEYFLKTIRANPSADRALAYKTVVQKIYKIRMITIPNLESGGMIPNFQVICKGHIFYEWKVDEEDKSKRM